ncbi:polysaccharide biosynthesis tyrosine autokinase [bacterium]|nr:polysaccharide biosynthesis tyrosine autokinase [bacterium]
MLRRNAGLFIAVWTGFVAAVAVLSIRAPREYEASATLSIQEQPGWNEKIFNLAAESQQKYWIKNQVTILESRTLTADVVNRLAALGNADSLEILQPAVRGRISSLLARLSGGKANPENVREPAGPEDWIDRFYASTRVSYGRDSDILYLKGRSHSAREAAILVNVWVDAYRDFNRSDNRGEVIQVKNFLETKLLEMETALAESEEKLKRYQKRSNVVSLPEETAQIVQQLASFESQYNQAKTESEAAQNQLAFLKEQLGESRKHILENMTRQSNPVLTELQKQLAETEAQRVAYEAQLSGAGYNPGNDSRIAQMENRIRGLKNRIELETRRLLQAEIPPADPLAFSENLISSILEIRTQQSSWTARMSALKSIVDDYSRKLDRLPDKSLELARLERDVQLNTKIYSMLKEKFEQARIGENGQSGLIRVLDRAVPPSAPFRPNVRLNLVLAVLMGSLLAAGTVFVKQALFGAVGSAEDLAPLGVPVLGAVPELRPAGRRSVSRGEGEARTQRARRIYPFLVGFGNDEPELREVYRAVRTSLYYTMRQNRWKTLLVTSPEPSDGKTTTAANLAIAFAENGISTLLADADLRKPALDLLFMGSEMKTGLTSVLSQKTGWESLVRETTLKNLDFLAAGPAVKNAPEILGSSAMKLFLRETQKKYGVVILDSPPLLPVTDALVLSPLTDAVLVVVRLGKSSLKQLQESVERFQSVGARVAGAVLTGADRGERRSYRDYYGAS